MSLTLGVIIPTHNRVAQLGHLLQQLQSQENKPEQIIVVDDHSTDTTQRVVKQLATQFPNIQYVLNAGRYQRDAKQTGLKICTTDYIGFLDDDIIFTDQKFFTILRRLLHPKRVIQAKVILENLGKTAWSGEHWTDKLSIQPYPILELIPPHYECGTDPRPIYPLIEFGNFWPRELQQHFIDSNLILDAYGESYISSLKLYRAGIIPQLHPSLAIRHPGSTSGGSQRFAKSRMTANFTTFHQGYFYNMLYMHSRYYPFWIWLWLPYFILKSLVALFLNQQVHAWYVYAWQPMKASLHKHFWQRDYVDVD